MDVSIASIERLHRHQIYPIVLLIKFKSTKQIKEVKDSRYPSDKVSAKVAKEMYEQALKLEAEYRHHISGKNIYQLKFLCILFCYRFVSLLFIILFIYFSCNSSWCKCCVYMYASKSCGRWRAKQSALGSQRASLTFKGGSPQTAVEINLNSTRGPLRRTIVQNCYKFVFYGLLFVSMVYKNFDSSFYGFITTIASIIFIYFVIVIQLCKN